MALLNPQTISLSGTTITFANASGSGDQFPNTGRELLLVRNSGTSAITVTVTAQGRYRGVPFSNVTFSVPASGGEVIAGPFPPEVFNDTSGRTSVGYSAVTSVTVAVLQP
jgi:hypothetical protein